MTSMTSPILPCKKTKKIMAAQQILFFGGNTQNLFLGGNTQNLFFGGEHLEQEEFFFQELVSCIVSGVFFLQLVLKML